MINSKTKPPMKMISINKINILNPRIRNQRIFHAMLENIVQVGLKRPICVKRGSRTEGKDYDLVCGQGRIEAFIARGQKQIPAVIIDTSEIEALVMSLEENLARRPQRPIELLHGIEILRNQGYSNKEIARKTGMSQEYADQLITLLERGEERLLNAVESGKIPVSVAAVIAETPDENVQQALQEAYENNLLRGRRLKMAKRLVETRLRHGKGLTPVAKGPQIPKKDATVQSICRNYQKEADRQRMVVAEGTWVREKLAFITQALGDLCRDKIFNDMLHAEGLDSMPKQLVEIMPAERAV